MKRNKLYVLLSTACAAGYGWVAFTYFNYNPNEAEPGICIFKYATTIPCPSCGSTRSVISLIQGDLQGALLFNPFGLLLICILLVTPLWMIYDLTYQKESLLNTYLKAEVLLKRKWIAIPAILIVIINWVWNINKGL